MQATAGSAAGSVTTTRMYVPLSITIGASASSRTTSSLKLSS
ncbi:MAG: hypothetical protein M5U28_11720 [Sandaracinaceae bacterium]|nr:hypothetical protein [Sandaracinaceae bacterium]